MWTRSESSKSSRFFIPIWLRCDSDFDQSFIKASQFVSDSTNLHLSTKNLDFLFSIVTSSRNPKSSLKLATFPPAPHRALLLSSFWLPESLTTFCSSFVLLDVETHPGGKFFSGPSRPRPPIIMMIMSAREKKTLKPPTTMKITRNWYDVLGILENRKNPIKISPCFWLPSPRHGNVLLWHELVTRTWLNRALSTTPLQPLPPPMLN